MRLIDAEALIAKQASIAKTFARSDAQKSLIGRVMYNTENAPTIDVIPVEWLKKQFYDNPNSQWAEKCRDVFTGWQKWQSMQKEQEAR